MGRIELSDMIVGLRHELEEAQAKAATENLRFKVESIDIEAQVTVSMDAKAKAKAKWKFWILTEAEGSVEGSVGRELLQTIRLKLMPQEDGKPVVVERTGERPE